MVFFPVKGLVAHAKTKVTMAIKKNVFFIFIFQRFYLILKNTKIVSLIFRH